MNDTAVPAVEGVELLEDADRSLFYVVSKRKFVIMFLGTLGLYSFYWFFKNWNQYRDNIPYESGSRIWPFPRAVFSIFFVHSLFRKIKASASAMPQVARWSNTGHAWVMVALIVVGNILDRASARSVGSPTTDLLSIVILAPLLWSFLKAQDMINASCGDAEGESNHKLTKANWAWLVVGALMWLGAIFNLMTAYDAVSPSFTSSSSW